MEVDVGILGILILGGLESLESLVNLCLDRTYFKLPDSDIAFFCCIDSDRSRCSSRIPAGGLRYPRTHVRTTCDNDSSRFRLSNR